MTEQVQKIVELEQLLAKLNDSYEIVKEAATGWIEDNNFDNDPGNIDNVCKKLLADQRDLANEIRTTGSELVNAYRKHHTELVEWMATEHKMASELHEAQFKKENWRLEAKYAARMLAFNDVLIKMAPLMLEPKE